MKSNTAEIISKRQADIRSALDSITSKKDKFALVDYPNHSNVGDSAIWLGEVEYFKKVHNKKPDYVADIPVFRDEEMVQAIGDGTIFIHGGGNFGDIWPSHQEFRKHILTTYKANPVVQLPQSIHFDSQEAIEESKEYINAHPDFTFLVRDQESYDFVKEHYTCEVTLCPDMALYIGLVKSKVQSEYDVFALMRTDKEAKEFQGLEQNESLTVSIDDWLEEQGNVYDEVKSSVIPQLPFKLGLKALNKQARREFLYRKLAEKRLDRGLDMLASGKAVLTDRLHAHILSFLLDKPHVHLDNSYGKVGRFSKVWTADSNIKYKAETMGEAFQIIQEKFLP